MAFSLRVSITVLRDIEDGMLWYDSNQEGLGDIFEECVNDTFSRIRKYPFAASISHEEVRYKVLDKFPYVVLYEARVISCISFVSLTPIANRYSSHSYIHFFILNSSSVTRDEATMSPSAMG